MEPDLVKQKIARLGRMHREMTFWRVGGFVCAIGIVLVCASVLSTSVRDLTQRGPAQDIYVTELQQGLSRDVVPRLQEVASRTMTEMQPVVMAEFQKLNTRVPELTQATLKELNLMQTSLPKKAEKVLDETFTAALKAQEPKIRQEFPSVKEEQVKALVVSLVDMASTRGTHVADELLRPHTDRTKKILENIRAIETTEPPSAEGENADWQMGLVVLDLVREDTKDPAQAPVTGDPSLKSSQSTTAMAKSADPQPAANPSPAPAPAIDPRTAARAAEAKVADDRAAAKVADALAAAKTADASAEEARVTAEAADAKATEATVTAKAANDKATEAKTSARAASDKADEARSASRIAKRKASAAKAAAADAADAKAAYDKRLEKNR